MRIDRTGEHNPFTVEDGKVVDKPRAPAPTATIDPAVTAAGETWKWWGPIERPWRPDPVVDSLGRPEKNLQWWWRGFWQQHPQGMPK